MPRRKPGPTSIMEVESNKETFLHALDLCGGNISKAAKECGLVREQVYRHIRINPEFAAQVDALRQAGRRRVSADLHTMAQDHLKSHLVESWVPKVDENGEPVLNDDLEQEMVSVLSVKSITDVLKETRQAVEGESPLVALQVNNSADGETATFVAVKSRATEELMAAYGLTDDEHVIDADFEEIAPWDD